MNTRLIILTLLLMGAMTTWAQKTPRLVVWQKSGEKVYYELASLPETTFEDGQLVIKCKGQAAVYYQLENVLRYTYEDVANGIDLLPNERSVDISREGDAVTFRNLAEGATVSLYAANGTLLEIFTAKSGQRLTLSVGQHPAGVYIVKAGKETIKLMKP